MKCKKKKEKNKLIYLKDLRSGFVVSFGIFGK